MRSFLRKCRGALGLGLMWSVTWAAIFALLGVIIGVVDPDSIDPGEEPLRIAWIGGVFGFISGTGFGALLSIAEGRRMLRGLSLWRAALWGALGTAAFPLLTAVDNRLVFFVCPIGAALAAVSVAVAKRADLDAPSEEVVGSCTSPNGPG